MPAPLEDLNRDHVCHFYQAPSGQRCGSPALKGEYYCYHHHLKHATRNQCRVLIDPEVTCMEIPVIEDRTSIFVALAAVIHRLAENTVDTRRAGQMIYGLQVALQALPPAPPLVANHHPAQRSQAQPAAEAPPAGTASSPTGDATAQLATNNQQPATPAPPTHIPISKESLLYFLRSRHCANCNTELFPATQLTERANPGAPPAIIEEARPALPAPKAPPAVLPTLHAGCPVLTPLGRDAATLTPPTTGTKHRPTVNRSGCRIHHGPTVMNAEPSPQSTFNPLFALHSPRRSVSLRLARTTRGMPDTSPSRIEF